MAVTNSDNRPQANQRLGNISATGSHFLVHASKKLLIHSVRLLAEAAEAASNTNYFTFQLRRLTAAGVRTLIPGTMDTQQGLALGAHLEFEFEDELVLNPGETLELVATETGTATLTDVFAVTDYEVKGN